MIPTLHAADFMALSPLLILLAGGMSLLLIESFAGRYAKWISSCTCLAALLLALGAASIAPSSANPLLTHWLRFDGMAYFFQLLFLSIALGTFFLSLSFFDKFEPQDASLTRGEYFFLLLSALAGLILISSSADFLTLFLGLETLSIPLYILCSYVKKWSLSSEAAIKYFLMGAIAAGFLLYGIALIYGATGTTRFDQMQASLQNLASGAPSMLFFSGIALISLGLAFKAAIVPFHLWAPDVYEGAPTPVTAFMATGTKAGAFAAFALLFLMVLPHFDARWNAALSLLAIATLIYANFVAMRQRQLRRFFAYSGISHAGFLLIPLVAGTEQAFSALAFYLLVYALATFGAFAVLTLLDQESAGVHLQDLRGLWQRNPFMAGVLILSLLTLAGIPPTAGFIAKFYLFKLAYQSGYYALLVVGLLTAVLSAYYYLRIALEIFSAPVEAVLAEHAHSDWPAVVVGVGACAGLLALSIYPALGTIAGP